MTQRERRGGDEIKSKDEGGREEVITVKEKVREETRDERKGEKRIGEREKRLTLDEVREEGVR